ncbi:hypothetical protein HXX76_015801 [Chlamydomonas incerta]|uniref:Exostosin GT47 domain-containing protein n=1 Tax=Chlamydomonas incerta TaxID=51695 RepID=A0A835SMQ3_CHLIN|nr:hypothetical protein HXX76_015801 [Chlamydomonas incerta]|eukprot:KAG2422781.1 hypothetical protein HXX76_015801 [Chlamydomonas incerta]
MFRPEFAECIQPTTIIWVDTTELAAFFDTVLPHLRVPIILASGDSDYTAPKSYLPHLSSRKLLHWLAMNCDLPAATTAKLSCLPLGVSQWLYQDNPAFPFLDIMERVLGRGVGLQQGVLPSPRHPKTKLLLVAFALRSNVAQRTAAWQYACEGPLKGVATCASGWSLEETYEQTAQHAFVLAPEGAGPDTYRAWETLYLGSYPVVMSNSLDSEYVGLPVLVVESIHELTEERLWRTYNAFRARQWNYERLYMGYYHESLGHFRSGFNKEYKITYHTRPAG